MCLHNIQSSAARCHIVTFLFHESQSCIASHHLPDSSSGCLAPHQTAADGLKLLGLLRRHPTRRRGKLKLLVHVPNRPPATAADPPRSSIRAPASPAAPPACVVPPHSPRVTSPLSTAVFPCDQSRRETPRGKTNVRQVALLFS